MKPLRAELRGNVRITAAGVRRPGRQEDFKNAVFQSVDEVQIRATANLDAYFSFFSVDQNGGISRLYPKEHDKQELQPAGKDIFFPDEGLRQSGLKLRVWAPEGRQKAVKSVLVITTKEQASLLNARKDQDLTITDLMKELSELDLSKWVVHTVGYEVRE